jgi:hypothetical protein
MIKPETAARVGCFLLKYLWSSLRQLRG